jgi:hypothetical protein
MAGHFGLQCPTPLLRVLSPNIRKFELLLPLYYYLATVQQRDCSGYLDSNRIDSVSLLSALVLARGLELRLA